MAALVEGAATLLDVYRAQFKNTIALQLQYRAQLLIWLLFSVLEPLVYLVVWRTVAQGQGGRVGGYSAPEFAAYYITIMVVNHLVFTWIMYEFEFRIRQGQFSPRLLRPVHPIHNDIADNVTYKLLTMVVMAPAVVVLAALFRPAFHPEPWAVAAFAPALLIAFFLRFLSEWTVALVAFWTTRVAAVNDVYTLLSIFLSGWAAPLSLFPAAIRAAAFALPFRWGLAFPVELLLGRLSPQDALAGFGMQLAWLLVAGLLLRLLWRAAVRRYTAVGA